VRIGPPSRPRFSTSEENGAFNKDDGVCRWLQLETDKTSLSVGDVQGSLATKTVPAGVPHRRHLRTARTGLPRLRLADTVISKANMACMAKLLLLLDLGHEDISSVIPQSWLLSGGKLRSATRG
jgi:hypothetical protein